MAYIGKQPKKLGAGEDLPSQAGKSGQFLTTDGTDESWATVVTKTSATGSGVLPAGTTGQRDGSPSAGYLRWNTTDTSAEIYDGSAWSPVGGSALTIFPFYKADGNSDTIAITNGEFPFFLANGNQDNIAVT